MKNRNHKKILRGSAAAMLLIAVIFIAYALHHPEASFPWSNSVTYILYGIYLMVMAVLFFTSFRKKAS